MKKLWSLVTIILLALCLLGCNDKKDNDEDEENLEDEVFTVTFLDMNDNEIYSESVKYGKKVQQPEYVTYKGYDITGWYRGKNLWNFEKDKVTKNIKLKMSGTPHEYTIEYNLPQGATLNNPIYSFIRVEDIPVVPDQLPTVTYENEYFQGWFLKPDFINEVSFTNDLPPRDIILFPKFVGYGCDHSFYDGKCKYCGILFEDADPYDPFPEGMSCREMPELERCGSTDGWDWNYNKVGFDGKGMEVVIVVGSVETFDPYHADYIGQQQADKQRQVFKIEQAYNIDIVFERYPDMAAWGPNRVQWLIDNNKDSQGDIKGHIYEVVSGWVPTLVENNVFMRLDDKNNNSGYFANLDYEQSEINNSLFSVGNNVYAYSSTSLNFGTVDTTHASPFLLYNQQLVKEYGLEDPAKLWNEGSWDFETFEMYLDVAQQLFDAKSEEKIYAFGGPAYAHAPLMYSAQGGKLVDDETLDVQLGDYETIQFYKKFQELYKSGVWNPASGVADVPTHFTDGAQLFTHGELWYLTSEYRLKGYTDFAVGVVPYPTKTGYAKAFGELVEDYYVPVKNAVGYGVSTNINNTNGLNPLVLINIIDDLHRGLPPQYNKDEISEREAYIVFLHKIIWGEDKVVNNIIDAIMSIEDNFEYYAYHDYSDILSKTSGNGSDFGPNGMAIWNSKLVYSTDDLGQTLLDLDDIYQDILNRITNE